MSHSPDIALVLAGGSYNEEDFAPLAAEPGVSFRVVRYTTQLGQPDVILLPGTRDVAADYDTLVLGGLADAVMERAAAGCWIVGICGGMHMMSRRLLDPTHAKYPFAEKQMLGLLQLDVHYGGPAIFSRLHGVTAPGGCLLRGFETHSGVCAGEEPVLFRRADASPIGYGHGRCWGTYLHRVFDSADFRRYFIESVKSGADFIR